MDIKIILAVVATIIVVSAYAIYIQDMFRGKTRPHIYTWLLWIITQGTTVAGIRYGEGGVGALSLAIGLIFITLILLLSLKYGTKNITLGDTAALIAALGAVGVWLLFNLPVAAIFIILVVDLMAYIPSIRKTYQEPWSENILAWTGFIVSNFFAIAALENYNALTLSYLLTINSANVILLLVCLFRRPHVPAPK